MNKQLEQLPIPLLEWFNENARKLPWRDKPTPYHVWLSEIMLQQTRVAAVLDYYERMLQECPTVADLAALNEDRLMKLWQGLGYYSRARNLHRTSKIIVDEYGGEFPADFDTIRSLPGVGDYTAGAICSIAFGIPVPAVDGNVLRVIARIAGDDTDITTPVMKKKVTTALQEIIPVKAAGAFNQALMELGALICPPNGAPQCNKCPAAPFCEAYQRGLTDTLPVKAVKKARRIEQRDVFLIFHDGKVALRRRAPRGLLAGLWEFPNELFPANCPVSGMTHSQTSAKHVFSHVEWHMTGHAILAIDDKLPENWVWADKYDLKHVYAIPNAFDGFSSVIEKYLSFRIGV